MKRLVATLALASSAIPAGAMAQVTPVLEWADPGTLVPAGNAPQPVVSVTIYGENIPPADGGHPDYRQYWHIFVRNVGPDGVAGPWAHCDDSDGCGLYEFSGNLMTLQVDLRRWARVNHSILQLRYYTGLDDAAATDPAVNLYRQALSGWSNIWTWKIEVVPAEAPPAPPKIVAHAKSQPVIRVAPLPKGMVRFRPGLVGQRVIGAQGVVKPNPMATQAPMAGVGQLPR